MEIGDYVAIIISFVIGAIIPILVIWINNKHEVKLFERQKKFDLNKSRFDNHELILQQLIESTYIIDLNIDVFFSFLLDYENGNKDINHEYENLTSIISKSMDSKNTPFTNFNKIIINLESTTIYFFDIKNSIFDLRRYFNVFTDLLKIKDNYDDLSKSEALIEVRSLEKKYLALPKIMTIQAEIMDSIAQIESKKCLEI